MSTAAASPRPGRRIPARGPIFLWRDTDGRGEGLVLFVGVCPFPGCPERHVLVSGFAVSPGPGAGWTSWEEEELRMEAAWSFTVSVDVDGAEGVQLERARDRRAVDWFIGALDDELRGALRERFEHERAARDAVLGEETTPGEGAERYRKAGRLEREIPADRLAAVMAGFERGVEPKRPPVARSARRIGRNEACPCGSGKKYKRCCLASA
jgi:hypothetical protein